MFNTLTFPETMEEFIEQYKVVKGENLYCDGVEFIPVFRMKEWVEHLQPRKGEWIYCRETGYGNPYGHFECSLCGDGYGYKTDFCPTCGADMKEESDVLMNEWIILFLLIVMFFAVMIIWGDKE